MCYLCSSSSYRVCLRWRPAPWVCMKASDCSPLSWRPPRETRQQLLPSRLCRSTWNKQTSPLLRSATRRRRAVQTETWAGSSWASCLCCCRLTAFLTRWCWSRPYARLHMVSVRHTVTPEERCIHSLVQVSLCLFYRRQSRHGGAYDNIPKTETGFTDRFFARRRHQTKANSSVLVAGTTFHNITLHLNTSCFTNQLPIDRKL